MCALGSSQRRMEKRMRLSGALYGRGHVCPAVCASMRTGFLVWRGRKVYTFHRLCEHAAPCAPAVCAAALCGAKCKKRRPVDISAGRLLRMQKGKGALLRAAGPSLPRRAPFGPRALAGLYKLYNGNDAQRQPKRHGVLGHADMREAEGV